MDLLPPSHGPADRTVAPPPADLPDVAESVTGRARDLHRLKASHRCDSPGAANLKFDVPHPGQLFLCREFKGNRPARRAPQR